MTGVLDRVAAGVLCRELGARDLRVYLALVIHRNDRSGKAFPSVSTLASECGCDRRAVQRSLRKLETAEVPGFPGAKLIQLSVKGGGGRRGRNTNLYDVAPRCPDVITTAFRGGEAVVNGTAPQGPESGQQDRLAPNVRSGEPPQNSHFGPQEGSTAVHTTAPQQQSGSSDRPGTSTGAVQTGLEGRSDEPSALRSTGPPDSTIDSTRTPPPPDGGTAPPPADPSHPSSGPGASGCDPSGTSDPPDTRPTDTQLLEILETHGLQIRGNPYHVRNRLHDAAAEGLTTQNLDDLVDHAKGGDNPMGLLIHWLEHPGRWRGVLLDPKPQERST